MDRQGQFGETNEQADEQADTDDTGMGGWMTQDDFFPRSNGLLLA